MTYDVCGIRIIKGGQFDVDFRAYINRHPSAGARLLTYLELFCRSRQYGELIRSSGALSIYALPARESIDFDSEAGLLALVDGDAKKVEPLRFLPPSNGHDWSVHERWAEEFLRI